jgi:hypothetical protein
MTDTTRPINPYFDYTIVRDPAMFFGREDELSELYEAGHRLQSISIVGLRHIGKSSIFKYMGLPEVQERFGQQYHYKLHERIFIFIDLRDYLWKNREDFFTSVCQHIFTHARRRIADIRLPSKNGEDKLSELLEQIESANFHPVLLMDAFDKVTSNAAFDPDFFSFLRSLATRGRVSYITASRRELYEMSHEKITTSPFFDIFTTCKIGPLTQEAAMQLITKPAENTGCRFTPEEADWILDQAGRHPFFLQVTCRFLFDEKYKSGGNAVDMKRVQERVYNELLPHFTQVWEDLSEEQQKVVRQEVVTRNGATRQIPELSEPLLFRRYLYEQFNIDQFDITVKDIRDALDNLDDRDVLAHSKLSEMHYILKYYHQETTPSLQKKGLLVYEFLKSAFERLRAVGTRNDAAFEWRNYNILYYRYFRYHLANDKTAARLGIGSKRQYYREQEKAIQALLKELMEMEAASLNGGIS